MTEYWVSKKQYWCKYCSIFIRDDAPHETGLKHQGNKERYIRDLYKTGNKAKIDRAQEAVELAKIEAAAGASGDTSASLSVLDSLKASSHRPREPARPKDKYANYSSAKDLGFEDEDTQKTSYEIEQELKGRAGEVGGWEEVTYEPSGAYTGEGDTTGNLGESSKGKRKLGDYNAALGQEEDHESFKIQLRKRNPYDEDDWDPRSAIKGKVKREAPVSGNPGGAANYGTSGGGVGLNREEWTGRLELKREGVKEMKYEPGGGWVKDGTDGSAIEGGPDPPVDVKPQLASETGSKPAVAEDAKPVLNGALPSTDTKAELEGGGLFKKRRPPPASRKK